jgi:hypothetical protein
VLSLDIIAGLGRVLRYDDPKFGPEGGSIAQCPEMPANVQPLQREDPQLLSSRWEGDEDGQVRGQHADAAFPSAK